MCCGCRLCIELILLFCPRYYKGKGVLLEVCNQVRGSVVNTPDVQAGLYLSLLEQTWRIGCMCMTAGATAGTSCVSSRSPLYLIICEAGTQQAEPCSKRGNAVRRLSLQRATARDLRAVS